MGRKSKSSATASQKVKNDVSVTPASSASTSAVANQKKNKPSSSSNSSHTHNSKSQTKSSATLSTSSSSSSSSSKTPTSSADVPSFEKACLEFLSTGKIIADEDVSTSERKVVNRLAVTVPRPQRAPFLLWSLMQRQFEDEKKALAACMRLDILQQRQQQQPTLCSGNDDEPKTTAAAGTTKDATRRTNSNEGKHEQNDSEEKEYFPSSSSSDAALLPSSASTTAWTTAGASVVSAFTLIDLHIEGTLRNLNAAAGGETGNLSSSSSLFRRHLVRDPTIDEMTAAAGVVRQRTQNGGRVQRFWKGVSGASTSKMAAGWNSWLGFTSVRKDDLSSANKTSAFAQLPHVLPLPPSFNPHQNSSDSSAFPRASPPGFGYTTTTTTTAAQPHHCFAEAKEDKARCGGEDRGDTLESNKGATRALRALAWRGMLCSASLSALPSLEEMMAKPLMELRLEAARLLQEEEEAENEKKRQQEEEAKEREMVADENDEKKEKEKKEASLKRKQQAQQPHATIKDDGDGDKAFSQGLLSAQDLLLGRKVTNKFPSFIPEQVIFNDIERSLWSLYPEEALRLQKRRELKECLFRLLLWSEQRQQDKHTTTRTDGQRHHHHIHQHATFNPLLLHYYQGLHEVVGYVLHVVQRQDEEKEDADADGSKGNLKVIKKCGTSVAATATSGADVSSSLSPSSYPFASFEQAIVCSNTAIARCFRPMCAPSLIHAEAMLRAMHVVIEEEDPTLASLLTRVGLGPSHHYAVSWLLTWFSHEIEKESTLYFIFDLLFAMPSAAGDEEESKETQKEEGGERESPSSSSMVSSSTRLSGSKRSYRSSADGLTTTTGGDESDDASASTSTLSAAASFLPETLSQKDASSNSAPTTTAAARTILTAPQRKASDNIIYFCAAVLLIFSDFIKAEYKRLVREERAMRSGMYGTDEDVGNDTDDDNIDDGNSDNDEDDDNGEGGDTVHFGMLFSIVAKLPRKIVASPLEVRAHMRAEALKRHHAVKERQGKGTTMQTTQRQRGAKEEAEEETTVRPPPPPPASCFVLKNDCFSVFEVFDIVCRLKDKYPNMAPFVQLCEAHMFLSKESKEAAAAANMVGSSNSSDRQSQQRKSSSISSLSNRTEETENKNGGREDEMLLTAEELIHKHSLARGCAFSSSPFPSLRSPLASNIKSPFSSLTLRTTSNNNAKRDKEAIEGDLLSKDLNALLEAFASMSPRAAKSVGFGNVSSSSSSHLSNHADALQNFVASRVDAAEEAIQISHKLRERERQKMMMRDQEPERQAHSDKAPVGNVDNDTTRKQHRFPTPTATTILGLAVLAGYAITAYNAAIMGNSLSHV